MTAADRERHFRGAGKPLRHYCQPAPAPLRGADHSSKKHPDRRQGRLIRGIFQVSFSSFSF